jgi:hypothetical protein
MTSNGTSKFRAYPFLPEVARKAQVLGNESGRGGVSLEGG